MKTLILQVLQHGTRLKNLKLGAKSATRGATSSRTPNNSQVAPRVILTMALVLVFISNTIEAQTIVSSEIFTEGDYASSDISDNGTYVNIVVTNVNNYQGLSRTLEKQDNGTFTIVNTFNLLKGPGSEDAVRVTITTISISGKSYTNYQYGWSGDDVLARLQKNLPDGTSVNVLEYVNDGVATMKVINGDLYAVFGAGANFDPGTLGGLPNLSGGYFLLKISGTTDQYVWSTFLGNDFVWNSDVEIMKKPGDEDNLYLNKSDGSLVKFSLSDGTNLGTVKTGIEADKYRFESDGNLHRLVTSQHKLIIYDVNDNYNSVVDSTDWSQANLWNYGMSDWKISNGKLLGTAGSKTFHLNESLIHGYLGLMNSSIDITNMKKTWINNDQTIGYITEETNSIKIITVDEGNEDTSLLPTLSNSDPNIVAVFDGKVYDGNNWVDAYHQSTIVFADGTLPSIGDTPDASWVTASPGTTILGFNPVEQSLRGDGHLIFRTGARKDGTTDVRNLKVFLVEESDVTLNNYVVSIAKVSDGSEPNTDTQFEISVTPTNTSGVAITGNITYSGTATEGVDYTGVSGFSIPDGSSSVIISLSTIDDSEVEDTESIVATISGLSNGSLGTDNASADLYDDGDVGIEEIENSLSIYPNPANDYISVSLGNNTKRVVMCDISGRVIYNRGATWCRTPINTQIDISNLNPGIYFIKLFTESGIFVRKFVKE